MLRLSCIGSGVVRGRSKLLSCRGSGQYGFLVRVVIVSPVVGLLLRHAGVWYVFISNNYASLENQKTVARQQASHAIRRVTQTFRDCAFVLQTTPRSVPFYSIA
jgi:hypothetical protein